MEITIKENHEIEFHLNFLEKIQLGLFAIDVGVDALINKVTQTVQDAFHSEIPSILESFQKAQKKCKYLILRKKYLWKTYTSHVARLKEFLLTPEENDFYALIQNLSTNDEISNICLIETFKTVLTIIDVFEQIEETKDEIEDLAKHLQKLNGDKKFLADMRSQIQELNSLITSEMLYGLVPFTQSVLQNKNLLWDLANWINYYDFCLKMVQTKKLKTFPEVDQEEFKTALNQHLEQFPLPQDFNPNNHYGFIEKRQFENSTRIFVRADLHGDLKSLIENLKTLQKKGLLDENYHCRPDVQLVFLGDYADRGDYSLQVLKLLISLHLNNPEQVILIQGNHEDTSINTDYAVNKDPNDPLFGEGDKKLESFLQEEANRNLLDRFYTTLPLAVYAGQKQSNGNCQYTLFTHGLFELHIDPIEMLNSPNLTDKMLISKEIKMNDRMQNIADRLQALDTENITEEKRNKKKRKLQRASEIVNELFLRFLNTRQNFTATAYAWADIAPLKEDSGLDSKIIKNRLFQLAIQDVKHWLELCSDKHSQIKAIIKGHQHYIENTILSDRRVIVYTLSTGMDTCYFKDYPQPDKSLLLTTQEKIKQAFLRKSGCNGMAITEEYPFYAQKEIRFSQITPNGTIQPLSEKDTKLSTEDNPIIPI